MTYALSQREGGGLDKVVAYAIIELIKMSRSQQVTEISR